jgi:molybdenum cofactor cytidylyltransferase
MARIACIVLAAGLSRRWGPDNKLMAAVGGAPMIARTVAMVLESSARPVIAVLGHEADSVRAAIGAPGVEYCVASDFATGMAASLKAGISALPPDCDGALICLGDMPWVRPATLDGLAGAFDPAGDTLALVPTYAGAWGNPVLLGKSLFPAIGKLSGDRGARALLSAIPHNVAEIAVDDPGVLRDADQPDQLREALSR